MLNKIYFVIDKMLMVVIKFIVNYSGISRGINIRIVKWFGKFKCYVYKSYKRMILYFFFFVFMCDVNICVYVYFYVWGYICV